MAFILAGGSGGSFGSSSLSLTEQSYAPVYDEEIDLSYMWNLLPSFYQTFMTDKDIFNSLWSSTLPALTAETLNLWHIDYAKSLVDAPVYTQRKWVKLDLMEEELFDATPTMITEGIEGLFVVDKEADRIDATWQNRGGIDRSYKLLRGEVTEGCSLSWSFDFTLTDIEKYGVLLVGYMNSSADILSNGLLAGVVGTSSSTAELFILHAASSSDITHRRSSISISADKVYRITCSYSANSTEFTGSITEVYHEKISSAAGETGVDDTGDFSTNQITDTSVSFSTAEVTAEDYLLYDGRKYEILEVQDTVLYTELSLLPAESTIPYTIEGEKVLSSLAVNLEASAGDNKFTCDSFGTCVIDTRNARAFLVPRGAGESGPAYLARYPSEFSASKSRKLSGHTTNWHWSDPTSEYSIIHLPRLQKSYTDSADALYEHIDYSVSNKLIRFHEPPPAALYAEYVAYDEKKIYNNFGHYVGVGEDEISSESLRSRIRGLFYSYFRGPTLNAMRTGVQIHLGLPIAEEAGEVEAINESYSGEYGQLVISGKGYLYPLSVGTSLTIGDSVEQFQVLSEGVRILDYINSPDWIDYFSGEPYEFQKYHQFLVEMNLDAFDVDDLKNASVFVNTIKPTWKSATFLAFKDLEDDQDIADDLLVLPALNIYDSFLGYPDPLYSGLFYGATPALPSAGSPVEGTTGATTITGVRVGVSSEFVSGSYWISDWLAGGSYSGEPIADLIGNVQIEGSASSELVSYDFVSDSPGLDGFVSTIRNHRVTALDNFWARSFIEKRTSGTTTEYRIHIFSSPDHSSGSSHRIRLRSSLSTIPANWGSGFNWYELTSDPAIVRELYPAHEKEYDWTFDSGMREWDKPALALARTSELHTRNLLWRDTSDESFFLTGNGRVVEGYNRDAGAQVKHSGDSLGVRSRVANGNLVAEIGYQVHAPVTASSVTTTSVPSGSSATTALAVSVSGADFSAPLGNFYIGPVSSSSVANQPIWHVFVNLKWSSTSNWLTDGSAGDGYSYTSLKVLSRTATDTLCVDTSSLSSEAISAIVAAQASSGVVVEVRRGGPAGKIIANGDLSNSDGCTSSDHDDFFVSSTGNPLAPDIADWGASGAPLEGYNVTVTPDIHGVDVNMLDEDAHVYVAFRWASGSAGTALTSDLFGYSDWVIGKVAGYGTGAGGTGRLHFETDDMTTWGDFVDDTTGLEWVMYTLGSDPKRLALYKSSSGVVAKSSAESNALSLGSKEELFTSTTGIEIYRPTAAPTQDPRLRILGFGDSIKLALNNVEEGDSIVIEGTGNNAVDGKYAIDSKDSENIGGTEWPVVYIEHQFPDSIYDSAGLFTAPGATIKLLRSPAHQVRPNRSECRIVVGGNTHRILTSEYETSGTSITVDKVFSTTEDIGFWYSYDVNPEGAATVTFLHTDEWLSFAKYLTLGGAFGSVSQDDEEFSYVASLIDNTYYDTYFDQITEMTPDEDVSLQFTVTPGAGDSTYQIAGGRTGTTVVHGGGWSRWFETGALDDTAFQAYNAGASWIIPIFGNLLFKGHTGGKPVAAPYTATSSDSSATSYQIFEDVDATFTTDISDVDGNNQPNNATFVCLTKDTSTSAPHETLWKDWLPKTVRNPSDIHPSLFEGEMSARTFILQVVEVLSDTQLLLRWYATGEDPDLSSVVVARWFNTAAHLEYEVRDSQGLGDNAHVMCPYGVWFKLDSYKSGVPVTAYDDDSIPGDDARGHALPEATTVYASADNDGISLDLIDAVVDPAAPFDQYKRNWHCPVYFYGTLTNGSATITPDGSMSTFNNFVRDNLADGCYLQAAPTRFTTIDHTDPTSMIADGPVFEASVVEAVSAKATITVLSIPTSPFTITYDDGSAKTVTISGTWASVGDVKNAIIMGWPSGPSETVGAGETYPSASADALEVFALQGGADGNSITLSTSDSSSISMAATLAHGADAEVSVASGTYSGVTATSSAIVLRSLTNPFPIVVSDGSITDWYTQSSGDTVTTDIEEKVPE